MFGKTFFASISMIAAVVPLSGTKTAELQAQARLLMTSPDVSISGTFDIPTRLDIFEGLLRSPILLARLWEAYQFSPAYKARLQGEAIHIDDPTGISGEIFLVEQTARRRVYVGSGALNHKLVPAFQGKIAIVLSTVPKGSAESAHVDVYVRADSRVLGFLAWTLFPLLKARVEFRINANANDIGTILKDLTGEPQKVLALLKPEDKTALLKIMPIPATPPAARK
jgi:hypothetical protein